MAGLADSTWTRSGWAASANSRETGQTRRAEEMSMTSTVPANLQRRLRLALAGAVVATALTAATAAASTPPPTGGQAPAMTRLGASPSQDPSVSSPPPGFLLERGRFKPVPIPRGLEDLAPQGISPIDINDQGQLVGSYTDPTGAEHGFRLDRNRFTTVDVPGAKGTQAQGINNRGQIVGKYSTTTGAVSENGAQVRGFLLDRGRYVRLDVPSSVTSQAFDINDRGQVVGEYQDAAGRFHGYVCERGAR